MLLTPTALVIKTFRNSSQDFVMEPAGHLTQSCLSQLYHPTFYTLNSCLLFVVQMHCSIYIYPIGHNIDHQSAFPVLQTLVWMYAIFTAPPRPWNVIRGEY